VELPFAVAVPAAAAVVVVAGVASLELARVGVGEWMSEGSQGWRIGAVVGVGLVPVGEAAAAAAAVGNTFAFASLA
jgi:hypothetical protein